MDRRRILLIIAAVIAAMGTLLVFLYVRSADARAQDSVEAVQVLTASQPIAAGESYDDAWQSGPNGWVANAKAILAAGSGQNAGMVLWIGDSVAADEVLVEFA